MAGTIAASTVISSTIVSESANPTVFQNNGGTEVGQLCKAWAYTGDGSVINAAFNVSSCSEPYTTWKQINFTNAFADANYAVVVTGHYDTGGPRYGTVRAKATNYVQVSWSDDPSDNDVAATNWAIFR